MPAGIDHFIHGYGQRALIGTNHPRQLAPGFEAFVVEPAASGQGAPGRATNGLIKAGQAASRNGAQLFQGHIGGGDLHKRWDVMQQHHDRLAGVFFWLGNRCRSCGCRRCYLGLCNRGGGRLTGQGEAPVTGDDSAREGQAG
ncbi:hypothetical protein D9M71_539490 [compost metagenome]